MKVLLTKNVPGTGNKGQITEVSDGFARNFLIKQGLAKPATQRNFEQNDAKEEKKNRLKEREKKEQEKLARRLKTLTLTIKGKTNETGSLYASISSKEICEALQSQHGLELNEKNIVLDEPIKKTGNVKVGVRIAGELSSLSINIEPR